MQNKKRISAYDGLKGLAILAIVFYHLIPERVPGGFLMVNTFFALAGFFFTYKIESLTLQNNQFDWKAMGGYIKATIERLFFPLFWMIGIVLISYLLFAPDQLRYIRNEVFSGLFFYNNFYQISADRSYFVQMDEASPFTHLWYNSLYLQSFLLSMLIVVATKFLKLKTAYKALIWGFIVSVSHFILLVYYEPGSDPSRVYYGLDTRFSSFAIGILMTYSLPILLNQLYGLKNKRLIYSGMGWISLIGIVLLNFIVQDQDPQTYYFWLPLYSVLSMGLIFGVTIGVPYIRKILSFRPFVLLGLRSYSYYLWYYPLMVLWSQWKGELGNYAYYGGFLLSLMLLAELSYQLIERKRFFLPFVTGFDWRGQWQEFNRNNRPIWLIPISSLFLLMVGYSLVSTRNEVPLFQFVFQHRELQTKATIQAYQTEAERLIEEVSATVSNLENDLDVYLVRQVPIEDYISQVQALRSQSLSDMVALQEMIADNQDTLDAIDSYDPELSALVPTPVKLFAAQVPVSFFGDSLILLSGTHAASNLFLNSNVLGVVSLSVWYSYDELTDWIDSGQVKENLVVNLGTNGGLDEPALDRLIELAGDRKIFLVNTNSDVEHRDSVNEIIRQVAAKYEHVYELDWYTYSKEHPEYYWEGEGIHHSFEGEDHFAAFVAQSLYELLGNQAVSSR